MRGNRSTVRLPILGVCVLVLSGLAVPAWGLGVNFSVDTGAVGLPATAVNAASDPADVYAGGGNTNIVHILKAKLGLQAGDNVDALCIPDPGAPIITPSTYMLVRWYFSVDPSAIGVPGSAVSVEAAVNEAAGDVFWTCGTINVGSNALALDEQVLGLFGPAQPEDDLDALDLEAPPLDLHTNLPQGAVLFSLKAGSPSLATPPGYTPGDILMTNGFGGFTLGVPPFVITPLGPANDYSLGITGQDLDALYVDPTGIPFFSISAVAGALAPGDVLVPDGVWGAQDGVADILIPANGIGLQRGPQFDNLNALDVLEGELTPPADPASIDGDGDGLPDFWEERYGLDPTDPTGDNGADGDPDGDTHTNKNEYDAGTDPQDPLSPPPVPLTQPWVVPVVVLIVIALAAMAMTYSRKRLV